MVLRRQPYCRAARLQRRYTAWKAREGGRTVNLRDRAENGGEAPRVDTMTVAYTIP